MAAIQLENATHLVVRRKDGEGIWIYMGGTRVHFEVMRDESHRIKIGVHATPDVKILRDELCDVYGNVLPR